MPGAPTPINVDFLEPQKWNLADFTLAITLSIPANKVRPSITSDIGIVHLSVLMMTLRWSPSDNLFSVDISVIVGLLMNLFYTDVSKLLQLQLA